MNSESIELPTQNPDDGQALDPIPPIVLTIVLLAIACVTLIGATRTLWKPTGPSGTQQIVICIFDGMLLALPILVSLWMALGAQTWIIRIPLASATLTALLGIYLGTIASQPSPPPTPTEVYWIFSGITLALTLSVQTPFWIGRLWKRIWISRHVVDSSLASQFSIKQLLIATTLCAMLLPLFQWIGTFEGESGQLGNGFLRQTIGFSAIFILMLTFLTLLSTLIVFSRRLRILSLLLLPLAVCLLPFAIVPSIRFVFPGLYTRADSIDIGLNIATFSASNALTVIVVLSLYRVIGFRLQKITTA